MLFPADRLPLAERFADLLASAGVERGLIGPREADRLWSRHLLNCAALARLMPPGASVCDVGSGAGLPGLVLALARDDLQVTLVEPLLRRCVFLEEAVAELALANVEVVRARADALHGKRSFARVTSRAVAPLPRLLEWSMPLVAPAGELVAMKGASAETEVAEAATVLHKLRCGPPRIERIGEDVPGAATTVVRVAWADPAGVGWQPATRSTARPGRPARPRRKQKR